MIHNEYQLYQQCLTMDKWLTLWRPLLPHRYSYKASCARPG